MRHNSQPICFSREVVTETQVPAQQTNIVYSLRNMMQSSYFGSITILIDAKWKSSCSICSARNDWPPGLHFTVAAVVGLATIVSTIVALFK